MGLPRFIRNSLLALALWFGAGALAAPVYLDNEMQGVPIGTHVELLEDPTGKLTARPTSTRARGSTRSSPSTADNVNLGFRDSTLWLRIRLERGASLGPWMLEVAYPMLDKLEFYGPGLATAARRRATTRACRSARHRRSPLRLPVEAPDLGVNVYHLRVTPDRHDERAHARLGPRSRSTAASATRRSCSGAYYGLLAVMMAYNLFLFFIVRDRAYAAYVAYVGDDGLPDGRDQRLRRALRLAASRRAIGRLGAGGGTRPWSAPPQAIFSRLFLQTGLYSPRLDRMLLAIVITGFALAPVVARCCRDPASSGPTTCSRSPPSSRATPPPS